MWWPPLTPRPTTRLVVVVVYSEICVWISVCLSFSFKIVNGCYFPQNTFILQFLLMSTVALKLLLKILIRISWSPVYSLLNFLTWLEVENLLTWMRLIVNPSLLFNFFFSCWYCLWILIVPNYHLSVNKICKTKATGLLNVTNNTFRNESKKYKIRSNSRA